MKHTIAAALLACAAVLLCACDRRTNRTDAGTQDAARVGSTTGKTSETGRTTQPSTSTQTTGVGGNATSSSAGAGQVPSQPAGSDTTRPTDQAQPEKPPDKPDTSAGGDSTDRQPSTNGSGPDSTTGGQTRPNPPNDESGKTVPEPPEDKTPENDPGKSDSQRLPLKVSGKKVARVIDGDSIALDDGNELRYIGIDAPEVEDPLHDEASEFNKKLVKGKQLTIEFDKERRDSHGRLLAYVYVAGAKEGERIFVNAEMVRNGFALTYRHMPNDKYDDMLLKLQKEARKAKKGIWKLPPPAPRETYYMTSHQSDRFHRPSCEYARKITKDDLEKYSTRDAAFDAGKSPCRECKP